MLPRERVFAALGFRPPDVVPLQIFAAPGGLHEHGQKLVDLIKACGHDFGGFSSLALPEPPRPEDFDPDGRYHAIRTDDWGTTWEYRIFGVWGHPCARPLDDLANLAAWRPPRPPPADGPELDAARAAAEAHRRRYPLVAGIPCGIFEKLFSLRRFEDVLIDIALDSPGINAIADLIAEHDAGHVRRGLALQAEAFSVGDDFGTQTAPLVSPEAWRRFFRTRYHALFEPVVRSGARILFHSCGQIWPLLPDLREIGVDAIWPQLPAFDLRRLAARCRELHLAVQLHPDRGELMQRATPRAVREYVLRLVDTFDTAGGGSWLYIEIDPGFPWKSVEALFRTAMELRGS